MRLKLELSPILNDKFKDELAKQIDDNISGVSIKDMGQQYEFRFKINSSSWHVELDKDCHSGAWYKLHCSTRELDLPIHYIKDLRIFCQQIARIKQMQNDFLASKYNHT
jgi:hypothetical protein